MTLSHAIGYDLGDLLYYGYMQGTVSNKNIKRLYTSLWAEEGEPQDFYLELVSSLKAVKRPG